MHSWRRRRWLWEVLFRGASKSPQFLRSQVMMMLPYVAILVVTALFAKGKCEDEEILTKVLKRVSDQDQRITKLEEENRRQAEENQRQNVQLAELEASRHTGFQGFHVTRTQGGSLTNGQTFVYEEVEVNAGNDYNANTGQYTCPDTGFYLFSTTSVGGANGAAYSIFVDGNLISGNMVCCGGWDSGSATVIVQCGAGMVVEVRCTRSTGCSIQPPSEYVKLHMFSGMLISTI